ncbi:MAG: hypothetical protein WCY41_05870 [Candidatus Micrarchaeia archaeon]
MAYSEKFLKGFEKLLKNSLESDEYWTTFKYTSTGNNYCHALTWGMIVKVLAGVKETKELYINIPLKPGKITFRPDTYAVSNDGSRLAIDFESPNSSDARVVKKDVMQFLDFLAEGGGVKEYIVVTSLPERSSKWELRYTSAGGCNKGHRLHRKEICKNPKKYWFSFYKKELSKIKAPKSHLKRILFVNINGKHLEFMRMWGK